MNDVIDAIEIEEELTPGFVLYERACSRPGCNGKIQMKFVDYVMICNRRTERDQVECTIGGEEHIR